MAELNLKQITDKLNEEFTSEERRLIFWYDDNAEFSEEIDNIELINAKVLRLEKDNQLYIKYFLEMEDRETSYLVYAPFPKPDIRENHLADTIHYSREFFVDRASLICADLNIADEYKPIIQKYVKFFAAQERLQRFYAIDVSEYDRLSIETTLISCICKIKISSFEESLRIILSDENLEENKYITELEKYGLTEAFWQQAEITFGYLDSEPTLEKLLMSLFITYAVKVMQCEVPTAWRPYISHKSGSVMAFLDNYMNNSLYSERFDELSAIIYNTIDGYKILSALPVENLLDCCIFRGIDEIILSWIKERLENEDTAATLMERTIPEISILRRKMHFGKNFRNEYFVLENAYYIIKDTNYSSVTNINDIVQNYTSVWYKTDMRYRYFNYYYDKLASDSDFEKLRTLVENIYTNDYLDRITVNWCNSFSESGGKTNIPVQQNFYNDNVKNAKDRVCVIISDALRYEVGRTLLEELEADEKCSAKISVMQSVLPSKTQTGMAALLPHNTYTLNADMKAEVDGKVCDTTDAREAQLKEYEPASRCVQFDALTKMNMTELREVFTDQKVVYVYHNQIDACGDDAKTEDEVFKACEEAVEEIAKLIRRLTTSANTSHFFVTADHGFLYKRDKIYESAKISGISKQAAYYGKRFAFYSEQLKTEGVRSIALNTIYSDCDGYVFSPVGTDIIKSPGSGLNYVHGGCSPQEMLVPVIEVKTERSYTETKKAPISLITPVKKITNLVLNLEFFQSEAVSDVVKEAVYKVFFVSEDGETISNENFILAEKTDSDAIHRIFKLRFSLKNKTYDSKQHYYLVAVDESNGMEALRTEFIIDIAFAGNFGF